MFDGYDKSHTVNHTFMMIDLVYTKLNGPFLFVNIDKNILSRSIFVSKGQYLLTAGKAAFSREYGRSQCDEQTTLSGWGASCVEDMKEKAEVKVDKLICAIKCLPLVD